MRYPIAELFIYKEPMYGVLGGRLRLVLYRFFKLQLDDVFYSLPILETKTERDKYK